MIAVGRGSAAPGESRRAAGREVAWLGSWEAAVVLVVLLMGVQVGKGK